jgi:murein DD-endopeptidase MepM/ murein hydrolase activator NlpD
MQILITHGSAVRSRVIQLNAWQLAFAGAALAILLVLLSGTIYHVLFQKAAREGWPVVSQVVKLVVRDEFAQRDRFMRENLDAMAQRVGEIQAKLVRLDAVSERVSQAAGVKPGELQMMRSATPPATAASGAQGGPYLPMDRPSLEQLKSTVSILDESADRAADVLTLIESRLLEARMQALMVPSAFPVNASMGSGFGFRADPFTGRPSLHAGLDFPADPGTPILAAAGGVVSAVETHPQYGLMVEIDHGRNLITRYAHASRFHVKLGDLVKRGEKIAEVGSTGRSTGPHLHFEVLVDGIPQDPARFLAGQTAGAAARATARR